MFGQCSAVVETGGLSIMGTLNQTVSHSSKTVPWNQHTVICNGLNHIALYSIFFWFCQTSILSNIKQATHSAFLYNKSAYWSCRLSNQYCKSSQDCTLENGLCLCRPLSRCMKIGRVKFGLAWFRVNWFLQRYSRSRALPYSSKPLFFFRALPVSPKKHGQSTDQ